MNQDLLLRAAKLNKLHHRKERVHRAASILSFVIVLCTVWSLMLPAVTLNRELVCGLEEHEHSDECYELQLVPMCGLEECEGHIHGDACYEVSEGYVCGLEESAGHAHTDACYTEERSLSCGLEEYTGHTHTNECFTEVLICENSDPEHIHDENCYTAELTCGLEESAGHEHSDACYTTELVLNCALEESEGHTHSEACLGEVKTLVCEIPESEGHTHSEECGYEEVSVLVCGKEEHIHSDDCYAEVSDDTADVETRAHWEATFAHVTLTGNYAEDVLAIARTQIGYTESRDNFRYDGGTDKKGYTRYGAWYGAPYGDWCAMFVSFCMRYAGVPESVIPNSSVCNSWTVLLEQLGRFEKAGAYTPCPGDVIFFDTDGAGGLNATHVGLVAWVGESTLGTIEGNAGDCVCTNEYSLDSALIYGYGRLTDQPDESVLSYTDGNIMAELTVSPALDGEAELQIEKLDPAEDEALWKNMAAPAAEQMIEEEDEPEALDLYRFSLLMDGEPLELSEDYELTLEASLPAPETDGENGEPSGSVQSFALSVLTEEELKALEEQEEAEQLQRDNEDEVEPVEALLTALMPETEEKQEVINEKEEPLPALKAVKLAQSPTDDPDHAELSFDGDGMFYGFALAAMPEAAPAAALMAPMFLGEGTPAPELAHSKTIDYLGDEVDNPDTTLDTTAADNSNLYRLYLDVAPTQDLAPLDLLVIVDKSTSMRNNSDVTINGNKMRRDQAVTYLLNGSTDGKTNTKDGLIRKFLSLNDQNNIAVAWFGGNPNTKNGSGDYGVLLNWTGADKKTTAVASALTSTNIGTNYNAGLAQGHQLLDANKTENKKVVVFISDGVPTFASVVSAKADGTWTLGTRYGNGSEMSDDVKTKTLDAINKFKTAHPDVAINTIGIGNFETAVLDEMIFGDGKTYTPSTNNDLLNMMEEIITGSVEKFTDLAITDTLSDYVQFIDGDYMASDIKVHIVSESGERTTLYENNAVTAAGKSYLNDNSVMVEGKTITVTFKNDMQPPVGSKLRLSYNVEVTQTAKTAGAAGYDATGDDKTDFSTNITSSNASGFRSNASAKVTYKYGGTDGSADYDHPVVQVVTPPAPVTPVADMKLPIAKTIDYLGDPGDNPDTDLDNTVLGNDDQLNEMYRLYLSAGPVSSFAPMDMLIVVDQSTSMQTTDMDGGRRDAAVTKLLNGSQNAVTKDGLISKFLALNDKNKVAVVSFYGTVSGSYSKSPVTNFPYTADTSTLLNWTDAAGWQGKGVVNCACKSSSGTDYSAAYIKMDEMFEDSTIALDDHQKVVVFLSDGVPTFYIEGTTTRYGNGQDSASNPGRNFGKSNTAFASYFTANNLGIPVYTIGIGSFDSTVLGEMAKSTGGTLYTAQDYSGLMSALTSIMMQNVSSFRNLTITDKLSNYVTLNAKNPDIKITVKTMAGSDIVLYQYNDALPTNMDGSLNDFTETASSSGTHFTDAGKEYLESFSFDPATDTATDTVTAVFKSGVDLIFGSTYTVSFNVGLTEAAYSEENKTKNTGDLNTDYEGNKTSSGNGGLFSNAENTADSHFAAVTYTYQNKNYVEDFAKPVVQVQTETQPLAPAVSVSLVQNKTIDYLGDGVNNPDTTVDTDELYADDLDDLYRLYLDLGQLVMKEPVDLLIVLDKSNSMTTYADMTNSKGETDIERYKVVDEIINGVYSEDNHTGTKESKGIIEKFLEMNPQNRYAVISFGGDVPNGSSTTSWLRHAYTEDAKGVTDGWQMTYSTIDCTPNDGETLWGTNYCAALYLAMDVLAEGRYSGHKQMMIFISDGVPTFWMTGNDTRYGNGSEIYDPPRYTGPGSFDDNSYYDSNRRITTKQQNIKVTTERINDLKNAFPNLDIYAIGVAPYLQEALATDGDKVALLKEMAGSKDKVYAALNYDALMSSIENIITGNIGNLKALTITDTLSDYVELFAEKPDFRVSVLPKDAASDVAIYESSDQVTGNFNDTPTNAQNKFLEDTATGLDGKDMLDHVSYHVSYVEKTKTVEVKFKDDITLDKMASYILSFNVKATQTAYDEFRTNERDGLDGYGGTVGDSGTDYESTAAKQTSSGKGGFYANTVATADYKLYQTADTYNTLKVPYDYPVIQVDAEGLRASASIIVSKLWGEDVTDELIKGIGHIKVRLYQGGESGPLTPVMDNSVTPAVPLVLTLTPKNDWAARVDDLPQKDAGGNDIRYFIEEVTEEVDASGKAILGQFRPVYTDPVTRAVSDGDTARDAVTLGRVTEFTKRSEYETVYTASVRNDLLVELPATGGGGTALLSLLGFALLALGALLLGRKCLFTEEKEMKIKGIFTMKKFLALLMTVLMVFTLCVTAFAAEPTGKITVSNATIGKEYKLYKVFDAKIYDKDETPTVAIAYTYNGTLPTNDYFTQDEPNGAVRVTAAAVGSDKTHLNEAATAWIGSTLLKDASPVETKTATTDSVVFEVPYGYYYVTSSLGAAVTVDSTTPDAKVIDKNQSPVWDNDNDPTDGVNNIGKAIVLADGSKVTENSVNYGDIVHFDIGVNATNYDHEEQILTYYVHDTMDAGFDYYTDTTHKMTVSVGGVELTENTGYKVAFSNNNRTFVVTLFWDNADGDPLYKANAEIHVSYYGKVNNSAVLAGNGNLNTAFFDYRAAGDTAAVPSKPDDVPAEPYQPTVASDKKITTTYVYAFGLTKIDGTTKDVLHGAEFTLKCEDTAITAKATATAGVYEYDATSDNKVKVFKTDANGVLVIKGLAEGSYALTEKTAPKGYNRTLTATEFTIATADKAKYTASHSVYYDASGVKQDKAEGAAKTVTTNYKVNVLGMVFENERGVELPVTGGVGTTLFYILGGVLVFGAMLLLITKKRMKAEK